MGFTGQLIIALLLNVALKIFTFSLTTLLTRLLHPHEIGLSFSYTVYVDSVLFIAREAVRNTSSRVNVFSVGNDANAGRGEHATHTKKHQVDAGTSLDNVGDEGHERCGAAAAAASRRPEVVPASARRLVDLSFLSVPVALATMVLFEGAQWATGVHVLPSLSHTASLTESSVDWTPATTSTPAAGSSALHGRIPFTLSLERVAASFPELMVWLSILLSASVEPCIAAAQSVDLYRITVLAEFVALTARLLTTIGLVKIAAARSGSGLTSAYEARCVFAAGQAAYALAHAAYCVMVCSQVVANQTTLSMRTALGTSLKLSHVCKAAELEAGAMDIRDGITVAAATIATTTPPLVPRQSPLPMWRRWLPFPYSLCSPAASCHAARAHATLLRPFFSESVLRLVLTDGEGFALSTVGSARARGYYSLVSGLGSLAARLIFRVWENACLVRWSRHVAAGELDVAVSLLTLMLRVAFYTGLATVLVGPPLAGVFLRTLYASRWSAPELVQAMQLYCYGIPCMAWNGLLEAFLRAAATSSTLKRLQKAMLVQSLLYVAVCYGGLASLSGNGEADRPGRAVSFLILANICAMLCRISYACWLLLRAPAPEDAEPAEHAPLMSKSALLAATPLGNNPLAVTLTLLIALSRLAPPSMPLVAAVGVVYVAAVLALDHPVRQSAQRLFAVTLILRGKQRKRAERVRERE